MKWYNYLENNVVVVRRIGISLSEPVVIAKRSLRELSAVMRVRFMIGLFLNLLVNVTSGTSIEAFQARVSL